MTQELYLKECIQLQNKFYDFIFNALNLPNFIQHIQTRLEKIERSQLITDNALISLIKHDFESDIFMAIQEGKLSSIEYIIEKMGVDCNTKDNNGKSLLHIACEKGHLPIVNILLRKVLILMKKMTIKELLFIMHVKMVILKLFNILLKKVLTLKQKIKIKTLLFILHVLVENVQLFGI